MTDRTWKLVEIGIDKGVLALVLAGFGFWLNRSLEAYKAEQAKGVEEYRGEQAKALAVLNSELQDKRSDREKKLAAIQSIRVANRGMFDLIGAANQRGGRLSDGEVGTYNGQIRELFKCVYDGTGTYLSKTFDGEIERYLRIHIGFVKKHPHEVPKYFPFFQDLHPWFERVCDVELGKTPDSPDGQFFPVTWDLTRMKTEDSSKYFDENFDAWGRWRQRGKN